MRRGHLTPETGDAVVTEARAGEGRDMVATLSLTLTDLARSRLQDDPGAVVFAARSRLARLGIEVTRASEVHVQGNDVTLDVRIAAILDSYGIARFLPDLIVPGLPVGRIIFTDDDARLSSKELLAEVSANAIQLPRGFSIDAGGRVTLRPHRRVYELSEELTLDRVLEILTQPDGKELLNKIQLARQVNNITLEPGQAVITSCSMFLHRHYAVLDRDSDSLGRHLAAVALDPISTRGTRVFLEFSNSTEETIVNPCAYARIYNAVRLEEAQSLRPSTPGWGPPETVRIDESETRPTYEIVRSVFQELEGNGGKPYSQRLFAAFSSFSAIGTDEPVATWHGPDKSARPELHDLVATRNYAVGEGLATRFGTSTLARIEDGASVTLLLGYFPNVVEHLQICQAAMAGKVSTVVFRRASYRHGPFFSSNDHSRLADYEALGLRVFWCNENRGHLAQHVFRGLRGYFMEPEQIEHFRTALIVAVYGSTRPLPDAEAEKLAGLIGAIHDQFGNDVSIITGGGPGAMLQATEIATQRGLLVGANYIEAEDQDTNQVSHYYQCFQGRSRHVRQRWFEVASFQLFSMGGLGTLEEAGLTLTDMKLGIIERAPVVFYGGFQGSLYWGRLKEQLAIMVKAGRAPDWLDDGVLFTDSVDDIVSFYRRILEVG